jgi:hypothetical protein
MTELQQNTREQILHTLDIFASTHAQQAWEQSLPGFVEPIRELICVWQGLYHPHTHNWFQEAFSTTELEALSRFDNAFRVANRVRARRTYSLVEFFLHSGRRQLASTAKLTLLAFNANQHRVPESNPSRPKRGR